MPDKDDSKLPKQDIPATDIPDLKKKEKERRKAGAAWGGARPGGTPFGGATGGGARAAASIARAAASAARGLGIGAAVEGGVGLGAGSGFFAGIFAQFGGFLSAMTATLLGKVAVMAAAALVAGLASVVGYRMMHGAFSAGGGSLPELGGIASAGKINRQAGDAGLGLAPSGDGFLSSGEQSQAASPAESGAMPDEGLPSEGSSASSELRNGMPIDKMAHDLSGSKLSSGLNRQLGAGSALGPNLSPGGADLQKSLTESGMLGKFGQSAAKAGQGGTLQAKNIRLGQGMKLRHLSSRSSRSLALLRGMAAKYNPAMRAGSRVSEANSAAAATQFQATELIGGSDPTSPTDTASGGGGAGGGGGTGGSTGDAAYTPTIDNPQCDYEAGAYWNGTACVTGDRAGQNSTPWQKKVDECERMVYAAASLLALSAILSMLAEVVPYVPWVYWTLCYIADILGVIGTMMGLMLISEGSAINAMGGSPQGTVFMIAGGVTFLNGCLATYFAWMGGSAENLVVVLAIVGAIAGVTSAIAASLVKKTSNAAGTSAGGG